MRLVIIACCGLLLTGCTSARKTYRPPSSAKVEASTKKVREGIVSSHDKARRAKTHVEDAQKSADKISVLSVTVQQKLDAIIKRAPPELQPSLASVQTDVTTMQTEEGAQRGFLDQAHQRQSELERHLTDLEVHESELESNQKGYYAEAQGLANEATNERNKLIAVEKRLIQQKLFGLLWKVVGGAVVIGIIALIFLWITGKLAFKFAK